MAANSLVEAFERDVEEWVRLAIARGVSSFPDLLRTLPGVHPTDAMRALGRLRRAFPRGWLATTPASSGRRYDDWPVEHPLDFDWRFTVKTARRLIDALACPGTSLTLLGAPSLAREAANRAWEGGLLLIDRNRLIVDAVGDSVSGCDAACRDLVWGEPVGFGDAHVIVADPPWYPEYTVAFLWSASRLARLGGRVLLSMPPIGTRPGILAERGLILAQAETYGLRVLSVESGTLAYLMPPFERNSLLVAGVPPVHDDWRRGDLATLVVEDRTSAPRPSTPEPPEAWDEVTVRDVRVKHRKRLDNAFHDPRLTSLVPDDMLPSVSRRDHRRSAVDIWTCGNRVFRCEGPGLFGVILSALGHGEHVEEAVMSLLRRSLSVDESTEVRQAAEQASKLLQREEWELAQYGRQRHQSHLAEVV